MKQDGYVTPTISDYGTLRDLTEASGFVEAEDGGNKLLVHHSTPTG